MAGYAGRSDGMKRAADNADEEWHRKAIAFVTRYARTSEEVFCDDLWNAGLPVPRELRALGSVMMQCVRDGVMERTGRYRASTLYSNVAPKPVWRSLVFEGQRTRLFMIKRKDGKYVRSAHFRGKRCLVTWTKNPTAEQAKRFDLESEVYRVRGTLTDARVVSIRVHRIRVEKKAEEKPASAKRRGAGRKLRETLFPKKTAARKAAR